MFFEDVLKHFLFSYRCVLVCMYKYIYAHVKRAHICMTNISFCAYWLRHCKLISAYKNNYSLLSFLLSLKSFFLYTHKCPSQFKRHYPRHEEGKNSKVFWLSPHQHYYVKKNVALLGIPLLIKNIFANWKLALCNLFFILIWFQSGI